MSFEMIIAEKRGRVGLITLNKPEKLNAWDRPMRSAILAARGLPLHRFLV